MTASSWSSRAHAPPHPWRVARTVTIDGAPADQLDQPGLLGVPLGHREVRKSRGHETQVEGALAGDLVRLLDHTRPPGEPTTLLGLPAQAGGGRGGEPPFEVGEGAPRPDGGERSGQREARRRGVVDVVGGHGGDAPLGGQDGQGVVAGGVDRVPVVPQLDGQPVPSEAVDEAVESPGRRRWALGGEGGGQRPLAAAGEDLPVTPVVLGQVVEGDDRLALLSAGQVGLGDDPAQAGVALGVASQHHQVGALGVGHAGAEWRGGGCGDGELGAEDGGQPEGPGRLGEADYPVETVVVGESEGGEPEMDGHRGQVLGMAGAVEEGEVRVGVELGVGHGCSLIRRWPRPTSAPARPPADGLPRPPSPRPRPGTPPAGALPDGERDHQRSSDGQGPAQAATGSQGLPSTDRRVGGALSKPRPDTRTGSPPEETSSAGRGERCTSAGAGGGIWPGQGALAAVSPAAIPSVRPLRPPLRPPPASPVFQVTNRTRSPGVRPPWRRAVTTPSGPRMDWTAANDRAARSSASLAPPQKPTSGRAPHGRCCPRCRVGVAVGVVVGSLRAPARAGTRPARALATRRPVAGSRRPSSSPLCPPATR